MARVMERYQERFPNISLTLADLSYADAKEILTGRADRVALILRSSQIKSLDWTPPDDLCYVSLAEVPVVALTASDDAAPVSYTHLDVYKRQANTL